MMPFARHTCGSGACQRAKRIWIATVPTSTRASANAPATRTERANGDEFPRMSGARVPLACAEGARAARALMRPPRPGPAHAEAVADAEADAPDGVYASGTGVPGKYLA